MKVVDNVLVVGGGIAGIQASLDLADQGFNVYLVEKTPSIGGKMVQLDKTFPTMDCSICILAPKMIDVNRRQNIRLLTYSEIKEVTGEPGKFSVKLLRKPRFVDEKTCTGCGDCIEACPVSLSNEFDMDLGTRTAIYRPFPQAVPKVFTIDKRGIPSCRAACPAGVNVQGYIALIRDKKFKEALELIRKDNPFPIICGRVCFHPCETQCERGNYDEPVAINSLKRFVTDWELEHGLYKEIEPIVKRYEEKIAIIGSGPTGLTAAQELVKKGYPVTVFETSPEPGGMLRTGIPEYRLPKKLLEIEIKRLEDLGVDIKTSTNIGSDLTIHQLQQRGYKAILIAIGAQKSRKLDIEGENHTGVFAALEFLKDINLGKKVHLGDRVAVIGGGNVAVDAARTALRLGSKDVRILYRRSKNELPAFPSDAKEAENEGVKFEYLVTPTRIQGKKGKVTGLECIQMKLGKLDSTGRKRPLPINDSEFILDTDAVVVAIGETLAVSLLPEVEVTNENTIECDSMTLATAIQGVFAAGDAVSGPSTVVDGIAAGKRVASSIDQYLRGDELKIETPEVIVVKEVSKENIEKKARQIVPVLSIKERSESFNEVEMSFTEEMALQEATRCLNCGGCSLCLECEKVCEPKAIIHDQKQEIIDLNVGAIIVSTGFVPFDPSSIKEYGYGKHKNVLTSLELERLLSASGPTKGELLRPSDKQIPHKIAFIQCVGSRNLKDCHPYCSSVCCMYATKEAALIKEHERKSEVSIFYTDIRAFGKGFREFVNRAKNEWGIKYFRAKPSDIREDPKTLDLSIKFEDTLTGEIRSLQVDLVVLCTALVPPPDNKVLAETLGIKLDENGFFEVGHLLLAPLDATKPGIFLSGCCHNPQDIPDSVAEGKGAAARAAEFLATIRS